MRKIDKEIIISKVVVHHDLRSAIPMRLQAYVYHDRSTERKATTLSHLVGRIAHELALSLKGPTIATFFPMPLPTVYLPPRWHRRFQEEGKVLPLLRPLHKRLTWATS